MVETEFTQEVTRGGINAKLDELICAVKDLKNTEDIGIEHKLWSNAQVASYIGVTYKYANEYIVTHHEFPIAIRLPNRAGKTGNPRWYAKEVIEWVSRYREC